MNEPFKLYLLLSLAGLGVLVLVTAAILDQLSRSRQDRAVLKNKDAAKLPSPTMRKIRSAGIEVPGPIFHAFALIFATLVALLVTEFFADMIIAGTLALLVSLYVIYSVVFEIGNFRASRFEGRLVDAIDIMASTMKGSENPRQALESSASVVPSPVGPELQEVIRRLELGMDIRRALMRIQSNYDSEGVRMFCSTLTAKWAIGGDLAPTLINLNRLIRERLRHRLRLRSRLAGAQISAGLVSVSPYFILLALYFLHPVWIQRLLSHPLGPTLLFFAVCCQLVGLLWLRRIMRWEM
ncbi:MAG: tight adherence protein B [Kiritimatiellia bacterium]|jgi:tight adherence protein B